MMHAMMFGVVEVIQTELIQTEARMTTMTVETLNILPIGKWIGKEMIANVAETWKSVKNIKIIDYEISNHKERLKGC